MSRREFDPSRVQIGVHSYMRMRNETPKDMPSYVIGDDSFIEVHPDEEYSPPPQPQRQIQKTASSKKKLMPSNSEIIQRRINKLKSKRVGGKIPDLPYDDVTETDTEHNAVEAPLDAEVRESDLKVAQNSYMSDPESNPIKIMLEMDDRWQKDWIEWEPETIIQTSEKEGIDVPKVNLDKIMALKVIINTPEFFESARAFEKICVAFSNRIVDWGTVQSIRVHDISSTIALVLRFLKDEKFSDDVSAYIAASAIRDGYIILPDNLKFVREPFNNQLRKNIGEDVDSRQEELLSKIKEDRSDLSEEESVQLLRIVRYQQHVAEKLNEVYEQ